MFCIRILPPILVATVFLIAPFFVKAADDMQQLRAVLETVLAGKKYEVKETPIAGVYQVTVGPTLYYFSGDGRHMFRGPVVDLATGENITEVSLSKARKKVLDGLTERDFIEFSPVHAEHRVTVFTDIDCGYCRKLHREMSDYNALGISIRYLPYPRAGVGSKSYDKAVSVWCAKDRTKAMDQAKSGQEVSSAICENSVASMLELGEDMEVRGTPSLILEDGRMLRGYHPPEQLKRILAGKS